MTRRESFEADVAGHTVSGTLWLPESEETDGGLPAVIVCPDFGRTDPEGESLVDDIADALVEHLGPRGSACVITATHNCLNVPEDKHGTHVVAASYRGAFKTRRDLQAQLVAS